MIQFKFPIPIRKMFAKNKIIFLLLMISGIVSILYFYWKFASHLTEFSSKSGLCVTRFLLFSRNF